jgi:hypothetical protein
MERHGEPLLNLIFIKLMQFPASFSETDLIGSQVINLPPAIGNDSQIMQIDFITPVKVSAGIENTSRS